MRRATLAELVSLPPHEFLGVGRVTREIVGGEVVAVTLTLIDDAETVNLQDGDEFATIRMVFDPYEVPGG